MKWHGKSTKGINPGFLNNLAMAAAAEGAVGIYVISGKRTKANNTGVSNSNHLYGHAMDGYAILRDGRKVPLGTLLKGTAGQYGLRSGDVAGFYNGKPDPNHVDDGYNVGGVKGSVGAAAAQPQSQAAPVDSSVGTISSAGQIVTPGAPDQLAASIGNIPQLPGPDTVTPNLAGDLTDTTVTPRSAGETWQLIAAQGNVSPDTIRLAQLASYGLNDPSSGQ